MFIFPIKGTNSTTENFKDVNNCGRSYRNTFPKELNYINVKCRSEK